MNPLRKVKIQGYKSIRSLELDLKNRNILIGGNGAGKSNLLAFFEMLQHIRRYEFQNYTLKQGGANTILYNGRKITEECYFSIYRDRWMFYGRLKPNNMDNFYFAQQGLYDYINCINSYTADGFPEMKDEFIVEQEKVLSDIGIYHFHDTSVSSAMKALCDRNDNIELAPDGRNIAAILYRIKLTNSQIYWEIVNIIRMVAPYFQDFILRENPLNPQKIRLEWRKEGCEIPFGAEQLSDGTLRFLCIATLLCAPEDMRKDVLCIDEPELGLHPFAVTVITELMKKYADERQIIAATQSIEFMNEFCPEDIIVVDSRKGESFFRRVDENELKEWMEEYTLGELWQKNVIGGRP